MEHEDQTTRSNIIREAERLLGAAEARDVTLRLVGGLAVRTLLRDVPLVLADRTYKDIDFVSTGTPRRRIQEFMQQHGYTENARFNALNGTRRLLFLDDVQERQVDVFVDTFDMCHRVPIAADLEKHPLTLEPARLLLTKLQIHELNEKDQRDVINLVCGLDLAPDRTARETVPDAPVEMQRAIDGELVARMCAADWGLWRTVTLNLERVARASASYELPEPSVALVRSRLGALQTAIDAMPKTVQWRLRNQIGERVKWYDEPEEVG